MGSKPRAEVVEPEPETEPEPQPEPEEPQPEPSEPEEPTAAARYDGGAIPVSVS